MPSTGSTSSVPKHPKPADVATEAKRYYIPTIKNSYQHVWGMESVMYTEPLRELLFAEPMTALVAPTFAVMEGDPVDVTLHFRQAYGSAAGFICATNEKKAGGEWETAVEGVEERFSRRSTLAAALQARDDSHHYPIPLRGGVFAPQVVVFRGPHDGYEKWAPEQWADLPVCAVPAQRWPKLTQGGTKYSFGSERDIIRDKMRGAARICVAHGVDTVVLGDWGLGKGCRNPPQELAEIWRDIFLFDPDVRGRVRYVAFVFENPGQSTDEMIQHELDKLKHKSGGSSSSSGSASSSSSKGKSKKHGSSSGGGGSSHHRCPGSAPTDMEVFQAVFDPDEVQRYIEQPDVRCGIDMLTK